MRQVPVLLVAATCILASTDVNAQEQADSLSELRRQILILAEEIDKLKLGSSIKERPVQEHGLGPAGGAVYRAAGNGISLASYGEALYQNFADANDDGTPAGHSDQIDYLRAVLYVGYSYNEWLLFNSEIEFEHASTGEGGEVSVELAYLEIMFANAANLRAGLLLIPVGIVNEKHEPTTYVGTIRPLVEQLVIPTTWRAIGFGSYGDIVPWLRYRAYVVEGLRADGFSSSGIRGGRQSGARAIAEHFAITGKLETLPFDGGLVAGSFFWGRSGQNLSDSLGAIEAPTLVWSLHGEFTLGGAELRALYAQSTVGQSDRLSALVGSVVGSRMAGWYVTASYDLLPLLVPASDHSLKPYLQYERVNTQTEVAPAATSDPKVDVDVLTLGLMYQPTPWVAFKLDFRDTNNKAGTGLNQWNLALNYLF